MPYVVSENCRKCRFTDCVEVCPVDCFWGDDEMLYIDPDTCIDCGACEPVCPVQAIYPLEELPADQAQWAEINARKVEDGGLDNVTETGEPFPGAEERKKALGF
jgi:ferredoxin